MDEPLYRRVPCFVIATVDKFASLPWTGASGALLGGADRFDAAGFYGPWEPGIGQRLRTTLAPPDLIIRDELHLISGPLGSMAGLYETAIDALCARQINGHVVRPKIIASTATVRRAEAQIRALFTRSGVEVFPPPGPDRRTSFFAKTVALEVLPGRLYLGLAAPGRSLKVVLLRTYLTLPAAAQKCWDEAGGAKNDRNLLDPRPRSVTAGPGRTHVTSVSPYPCFDPRRLHIARPAPAEIKRARQPTRTKARRRAAAGVMDSGPAVASCQTRIRVRCRIVRFALARAPSSCRSP